MQRINGAISRQRTSAHDLLVALVMQPSSILNLYQRAAWASRRGRRWAQGEPKGRPDVVYRAWCAGRAGRVVHLAGLLVLNLPKQPLP